MPDLNATYEHVVVCILIFISQAGRGPSEEAVVASLAPPSYEEAVTAPSVPDATGFGSNGFTAEQREVCEEFLHLRMRNNYPSLLSGKFSFLSFQDSDLPSYSEAAGLLRREDSCSSTAQLNPSNTANTQSPPQP